MEKRLTELDGKAGYQESNASSCECINKLGKLEDIEDELEINLVTLFTALKNGIWSRFIDNLGRATVLKSVSITLLDSLNGLDGEFADDEEQIVFFSDYGKTWALTKEELRGK